jgi:SAM-dependent methyltransferase
MVKRSHRVSVAKPTKDLTSARYWDEQWSRLEVRDSYASLGWVSKNYVYRSLDRLFRSVLRADPRKTFIELGSGPARWMIYFHKVFGYRVFGCDYSPVSCQLARENLGRAGVPGEVVDADFFKLEGQYDVVFSGGVIEHFDHPDEVLATFARLVAPGGVLITDVPNLGGLCGLYQRWFKPETFETHRHVPLADLRRWQRALGLEELLATSYGSFALSRFPVMEASHPLVHRLLWQPIYLLTSRGINRFCLLLLRLGLRIDHPLFSPHLLVISRKPSGGIA